MVWVYYGVNSKFIALYPMSTESQGPEILEDLCSDQGAPIKLKNDHFSNGNWQGVDLNLQKIQHCPMYH